MQMTPKHRRRFAIFIAGMLIALFATTAFAQRQRISLDEILIEGNIQKPEAFFILPRTSLNFEDLERREDLKKRIIDSVEKTPF
jgi:hypothetical protein